MAAPKYPPRTPGVTRLTQSTIERYLRCGIRYELEMDERHRYATVKMMIGSGVAAAAAADKRAKMATGEGIPLGELVERSVAAYEQELEQSDVPESNLEINQGMDDSADAAREYGLRVSPKITDVLFVEQPIVAALGASLEIAGTPDGITGDGLGDDKVGKAWTQEMADRSRQISLYDFLHGALLGYRPRRRWIDNVFRTAKGWSSQRIYTDRTPEELADMIRIVEIARAGIEAGHFLPAAEGAWHCSASWCPHFARGCPVTQGKSTQQERIA
jgi:hypothetical protein